VCADKNKGDSVAIGSMSREWEKKEGLVRSDTPYVYDCQVGDKTRSVINVDIAKDGIALIVKKGGIADDCQQLLGGFTIDQLRWIYSSYSEDQLEQTGWDPASVPKSDGDSSTRRWSELDPRCAPVQIKITGMHRLNIVVCKILLASIFRAWVSHIILSLLPLKVLS
jgi:ABC-type phosphate transport system substrate-binding protein